MAVYHTHALKESIIVENDFYHTVPDCGELEDIPFSLSVSPDLASACLELAAWNMNRYRGRRIGMTGAVRGSGKDGEHLETAMSENVRGLLEPYKRRII